MSAVIITHQSHYEIPNLAGRYFSVEMSDGKHSVFVTIKPPGAYEALRVIVQNASHRAYRGAGKGFQSIEEALAAYKTGAIRSMIELAVELSKGGMQ